jgi:hypothetical protein
MIVGEPDSSGNRLLIPTPKCWRPGPLRQLARVQCRPSSGIMDAAHYAHITVSPAGNHIGR